MVRIRALIFLPIISAIIAILGVVTFLLFLNGTFQDKGSGSTYAAIQSQLSEKKEFSPGESAKIGPITLNVTQVTRNYQITASDKPLGSSAPMALVPANTKSGVTAVSILENDAEYIVIEGVVRLNGSKAMTNFDDELSSMRLNGVSPYAYTADPDELNRTQAKEGKEYQVRYVYRIAKDATTLTLVYGTSIYTKLNPIFGSEGAPSKYLTYTIHLAFAKF